MDWDMKKNRKYLLPLLVCCGVVPHGILSLLQMDAVSASLSPAETESYANFFVCEWMTFWMAFFSYWRLQKRDTFSLLPAIAGAVILLSYLGRFAQKSILTIGLIIPLILITELFAWLKNLESSGKKFLAGIAADRGALRAFFFWAVEYLCITLISCEACTWDRTVASPFLTFPIPAMLLIAVFRQQKSQPLTIWGCIGMLIMVPLSLFLVTVGPMEQFKTYHLVCLGIGYVVVFLLLIVYNMNQWRRGKR